MKLSMVVNIFAPELEAIAITKDSITIRTREVVPFMGDYLVAEITAADFTDPIVTNFINCTEESTYWDKTEGNLSSNKTIYNEAMTFASRKLSQELTDYVRETMACQCVQLEQTPFEIQY